VDLIESLGAETLVHVSTDGGAQFIARQNQRSQLHAGDTVGLAFDPAAAHLFDASGRVSSRSGAALTH
jgi:multiple sugar transport system ATP-binding protein